MLREELGQFNKHIPCFKRKRISFKPRNVENKHSLERHALSLQTFVQGFEGGTGIRQWAILQKNAYPRHTIEIFRVICCLSKT